VEPESPGAKAPDSQKLPTTVVQMRYGARPYRRPPKDLPQR